MPPRRPPDRAKAPRLPRLSPTRLNLYRFCPRAYGFYYDEGLRWGSTSAAQSFGGSLHRALQTFHARGGPENVSLDELKAQFGAAWSAAGYDSAEQAEEYRVSGERLLERYHEAAREPGRVTLATEATLQRRYDEFVLFGKIDRLDRRPDGALEVVDYKSGRREVTEREVRESLAMTLYQLLVSRQHPGVPVFARIVALRTGESASVLRSEAELDEVEAELVALTRTILADGAKDARPGEPCRTCVYPRVCTPGRTWLREHARPDAGSLRGRPAPSPSGTRSRRRAGRGRCAMMTAVLPDAPAAAPATRVESLAPSSPGSLAPSPGQGFRALTERWTRERVERVVALLHAGDRAALEAYLEREVPRVVHASDPPGSLDLKGISFAALGYRVDLGRVRFEGLNLWSSRFVDINLKGASFERCAMGLCVFESAYLRGARFRDCDLHASSFSRSNLGGARFERTSLRFSTWTATDVSSGAFEGGLHEENQGRFALAAGIYHALRLNLSAAGDEAGAGWATYRQCVMLRRDLGQRRRFGRWLASFALDVLWGYGERPWRLMACALAFCALCAACYFFTGIRLGDRCVAGPTTLPVAEHVFECLYFSVVTFTTVGYGDVTPCGAASRAVAAFEAFAGIFTMGLFVTANVRKLAGR